MSKFCITLHNNKSELELIFDLFDYEIANRWASLIKKNQKITYSQFQSWPNSSKTLGKLHTGSGVVGRALMGRQGDAVCELRWHRRSVAGHMADLPRGEPQPGADRQHQRGQKNQGKQQRRGQIQ